MSQRVLLLGATGQTGNSILNGLLEHGGYVCKGYQSSRSVSIATTNSVSLLRKSLRWFVLRRLKLQR